MEKPQHSIVLATWMTLGLATATRLRERIEYLVKTHPSEKRWCRKRCRSTRPGTGVHGSQPSRRHSDGGEARPYRGVGRKGLPVEGIQGVSNRSPVPVLATHITAIADTSSVSSRVGCGSRRALRSPLAPGTALSSRTGAARASETPQRARPRNALGRRRDHRLDLPVLQRSGRAEEDARRSAAPRNSRELAVRNQFFTPRYVVEFLTDNTLGRIWYEMTRGETRLNEQCRYLVRRPNGNLSQTWRGRAPPSIAEAGKVCPRKSYSSSPSISPIVRSKTRAKSGCSIPPAAPCTSASTPSISSRSSTTRPGKSRTALTRPKSPTTFASFVTFADTYPDKAAFLREVPRLIIEHNIHGIDIDPRCAQIAGLSLWLRAQKALATQTASSRRAPPHPTLEHRLRRADAGDKVTAARVRRAAIPPAEQPAFSRCWKRSSTRCSSPAKPGRCSRSRKKSASAVDDAHKLWQKTQNQAELFSTEEINRTLRPGVQQELPA